MSARQPVPRVAPMPAKSRNTKGTPGEFPFTELPESGIPDVKIENNHTKEKNTMNRIKSYYNANKKTIQRRAIVVGGSVAGLFLAGLATELAKKPKQEVVIVVEEQEPIEAPVSPVTDEVPVTHQGQ